MEALLSAIAVVGIQGPTYDGMSHIVEVDNLAFHDMMSAQLENNP